MSSNLVLSCGRAVVAIVTLLAVASCSDPRQPGSSEPEPVGVLLSWEGNEVSVQGGVIEYTFRWRIAEGDEPDPPDLRYEWSVDRLTSDGRVPEIPYRPTSLPELSLEENDTLTEDEVQVLSVRAVTDQGASEPLSIVFARGLIGPRSRITLPVLSRYSRPWNLSRPIYFQWDEYDPLGLLEGSTAKASGFECKLIEVPHLELSRLSADEILDAVVAYENILLGGDVADRTRWESCADQSLVPGDLTGYGYVFAVRALDSKGEPEDSLKIGRNVLPHVIYGGDYLFGMDVSAGYDRLRTTLDWTTYAVRFPTRLELDVDWSMYSSSYPPLTGANYALDVPDPDIDRILSPNGIGGWIGWEQRDGLDEPFLFSQPGNHTLLLAFQDGRRLEEATSVVELQIEAYELPPRDLPALLVDDHRPISAEREQRLDEHDERVLGERLYELGSVDKWAIYAVDGQGPETQPPSVIPLETLQRYRLVVWHHVESALARYSIVWNSRPLREYVRTGGRLLLIGHGVVENLVGPRGSETDPQNWVGTFLWEELGVRDPVVTMRLTGGTDRYPACRLVGAEPELPDLPALGLDPAAESRLGTAWWEGFRPVVEGNRVSPVEPLYTAVTRDSTWDGVPLECGYDRSTMAFRRILSAPHAGWEGRVVVLSCESSDMDPEAIARFARQQIDWLLEGL